MGRTSILGGMFVGAALFVSLVVVMYKQREHTKQQQREKNLREAGLLERRDRIQAAQQAALKPKAVTPEVNFEFGEISRNANLYHSFNIRNEGEGPLTLRVDKPSCTCIVAKTGKDILEPGEETEIELGFNPAGKVNDVVQWADILTNDPNRPMIRFKLVGRTIRKFWTDKDAILFKDLQPTEERTEEIQLFSMYEKGFELGSLTIEPGEVHVETVPLDPEIVAQQQAKSGLLLKATCTQKLPTVDGYITFNVKPIDTTEELPDRVRFDIVANRLGILGMYGTPLNELGQIEVGQLPFGKGRKILYTLKARGEDKLLKIKSMEVDPEFVKVSIVPRENAEKTGLHDMIVEIPPDAPQTSRLGKNGGVIKIEFEQEYYNRKPFHFSLRFAVAPAEPAS